MQHPHSPPDSRSPEILQRFQSILAVTAAAYGLLDRSPPSRTGPAPAAGHPPPAAPRKGPTPAGAAARSAALALTG